MTATPPAPTVTPAIDASPCPRVEILVSPMPVDADTITITRNYGSQTDTVRGATGAVVAGDFVVVDYEAPLGVSVTYTCVTKDASGTASTTSDPSGPALLDVADIWAQDPLDPSTSMPWPMSRDAATAGLWLRRGSFSGFQLPATQAIASSIGSRIPIGQSGVRQAPTSIPIGVTTVSDDAGDALLNLIVQAGAALCVRVPPTVRFIDPISYLQLGTVTPDTATAWGQTWWAINATAILGPSLGVIVSTRNYGDLSSEAATYSDLAALYATYLDMQRGS